MYLARSALKVNFCHRNLPSSTGTFCNVPFVKLANFYCVGGGLRRCFFGLDGFGNLGIMELKGNLMDGQNSILYIGLIGIVVVIVLTVYISRRPKMKYGEILPAKEMKEKYHLTADRYKPPYLDPEKVPEQLRDLIPLATKWGIGDDIIRNDFEQKVSEDEKQQLKNTLTGRTTEIQKLSS